jgi:dihydrofolate reductase
MGKRMFDGGELAWPEEAPFHTPVFVVTHTKRDPWERPGGTTFRFVNDGIESALLQAGEAAGDRDVRIAGGAETIQEYLDSGLIEEFSITLAPVLFGTGIRPHGGIVPGDPPDLHRRETLARVPAARRARRVPAGRGAGRVAGLAQGESGPLPGGSSQRKDLPLMSHRNARCRSKVWCGVVSSARSVMLPRRWESRGRARRS